LASRLVDWLAGRQASKQSKQSKQASQQASKPASQQASKPASKRASKQASKQAISLTFVQAFQALLLQKEERRLERAKIRADRRVRRWTAIAKNEAPQQGRIRYEPRRKNNVDWINTRHAVMVRWKNKDTKRDESRSFLVAIEDDGSDEQFQLEIKKRSRPH